MTPAELAHIYRDYIACLNRQDWPALGQFVHDDVAHNTRPLGLAAIARCWSRIFARFRTCTLTSSC